MIDTHRLLSYEKSKAEELNIVLSYLTGKLNTLDNLLGNDVVDKISWSWQSGIVFRDCTEDQMQTIKDVFNLNEFKKEITEYSVTLSTKHIIGQTTNKDSVELNIEFKFGLPDSCEVELKEEWLELDPADITITNGKFMQKTIKKEVKCNEPAMMKAIFKSQVENGV
tara:strand:- start:963 stop:1463 length:501 start_codon:yes stop_codon:yes gene_type:complete